MRSRMSWKWVVAAALLPLVASGVFVLVALGQGLGRFDARYFEIDHQDAYSGPGAVILPLLAALRSGDGAMQAELQGRADPDLFPAMPDIEPSRRPGGPFRLQRNGPDYVTYVLHSLASGERFPVNIEKVGGRWVFAPRDAYFYLHSGLWVSHATRFAIACWLAALLLCGARHLLGREKVSDTVLRRRSPV